MSEYGVVFGRDKFQIKQQAPIAIFRQTGEFVKPGDGYPSGEEGLDQ